MVETADMANITVMTEMGEIVEMVDMMAADLVATAAPMAREERPAARSEGQPAAPCSTGDHQMPGRPPIRTSEEELEAPTTTPTPTTSREERGTTITTLTCHPLCSKVR